MHRKTDSGNPADWLFLAEQQIEGLRLLMAHEVAFYVCRSQLAEVLEKVLKAELVRLGWFLEKTHDLQALVDELHGRRSELASEAQPLAEALAESYFADRYPGFDLEEPDWLVLTQQTEAVVALFAQVKGQL